MCTCRVALAVLLPGNNHYNDNNHGNNNDADGDDRDATATGGTSLSVA